MDSLDSPINSRFISGTPLAFRQMASQNSPADSRVPQTPCMNRDLPDNDQSVPGTPARRVNLPLRSPLTGSTPILRQTTLNVQELFRENFHSPGTPVGSDQLVPTTPDGFKPVVKLESEAEEDSYDMESSDKNIAQIREQSECYMSGNIKEQRKTHDPSYTQAMNVAFSDGSTSSKKSQKPRLRLRQRLFQEGSSSNGLASLPRGILTPGKEACSETSNTIAKISVVNRDAPEGLPTSYSQHSSMMFKSLNPSSDLVYSSNQPHNTSSVSVTAMQTRDCLFSPRKSNLLSYNPLTGNQNLGQRASAFQISKDMDQILKQDHSIQHVKAKTVINLKSEELLTEPVSSATLQTHQNNQNPSLFAEQMSGVSNACYRAGDMSNLQVSHNQGEDCLSLQQLDSLTDSHTGAASYICLNTSAVNPVHYSDSVNSANELLLFDGNDIFG